MDESVLKKILSNCLAFGIGLAVLAVIGWIGLFIFGFVATIFEDSKDYPGKSQFESANKQIDVYDHTVAFGNTPDAVTYATEFSTELQALCGTLFTGGSKFTPATGGHFLTYCRVTPTELVFLCQVPDLRGYRDDVRDALAKVAWVAAQNVATAHKMDHEVSVVVGLRGFGSYGPIWEGKVGGDDATVKSDGLFEIKKLYPYFIPPEPGH